MKLRHDLALRMSNWPCAERGQDTKSDKLRWSVSLSMLLCRADRWTWITKTAIFWAISLQLTQLDGEVVWDSQEVSKTQGSNLEIEIPSRSSQMKTTRSIDNFYITNMAFEDLSFWGRPRVNKSNGHETWYWMIIISFCMVLQCLVTPSPANFFWGLTTNLAICLRLPT